MIVMQVFQRGFLPGILYWFGSGIFAGRYLAFAALPIVPLLAGCGLSQTSAASGSLALPPESQVRVLARQIDDAPKQVLHYKWSLIGERNWVEAKAQNNPGQQIVLSLGKTYPLNSATQRGGCNIWEADLTMTQQGTKASWEARLHGSDGETVTIQGTEALKGKTLKDVLEVQQGRDTLTSLPADLSLARIGTRELHFKIDK